MKEIKRPVAILSLAAVLMTLSFASCTDGVKGTMANFDEAEKNVTTVSNHTIPSCQIEVIGDPTHASADTVLEVEITTSVALDLDSVERALNFYTLSDNPENRYYYPVRSETPLPKTRLNVTEPDSYEGGGTVSLEYQVDTSSVTVVCFAFLADATLLTDRKGSPVLNLDGNDKAGEESDCYLIYLPVMYKADGENVDLLSFREYEYHTHQYLDDQVVAELLSDSNGNPSGKIRFTVPAPYISRDYDASSGSLSCEYDATLASSLDAIYCMQTRAPSSSWVDVPLSFTYHAAADSGAGIVANTYSAKTDVIPYGSQWRLVRRMVTSGPVPDYFTALNGHPAYFFYNGSTEYTQIASFTSQSSSSRRYLSELGISGSEIYQVFTSEVYTESPEHIYAYGTGSATSFLPNYYPEAMAASAQAALLDVESVSEDGTPVSWQIDVSAVKGNLSGTDDFIITNEYNKKLESTVVRKTNIDGSIYRIVVSLKDPLVSGTCSLWVGKGLTLISNPQYPTQLHFGVPEDSVRGDISGYVCLSTDTFCPRISYRDESHDIKDYVVTYINPSDPDYGIGDYYRYYLDAGDYTIIHANGVVNVDLFTDAGYNEEDLCKTAYLTIGKLYSQDSPITVEVDEDEASFSIVNSGVYWILVCPQSLDDSGYAAFYIYR